MQVFGEGSGVVIEFSVGCIVCIAEAGLGLSGLSQVAADGADRKGGL